MGVTTFICKINSIQAFREAMKAVVSHNVSPMEWDGHSYYSDEEFKDLDLRRYGWLKAMNEYGLGSGVSGCQQKWTRGENIELCGFVQHSGEVWLECKNGGGGACSTLWLKLHFPEMGWLGTDGKPEGFYDAPMVASGETSMQLTTQLVGVLGGCIAMCR